MLIVGRRGGLCEADIDTADKEGDETIQPAHHLLSYSAESESAPLERPSRVAGRSPSIRTEPASFPQEDSSIPMRSLTADRMRCLQPR